MEDRNWVDYYKDATREQIIADVVNDKDYIEKLKHQLQAYKDKEDKLREYIKENKYCVVGECESDILQILNEGDK